MLTLRRLLSLGAREIGPIGTIARVIGAAAALVVPLWLDGLNGWDLPVGLVGLPAVATFGFFVVRYAVDRLVPGGLASQQRTCNSAACCLLATVIVAVIPVAALTRVTFNAFWVWISASLLLTAVRGHGGCEILAFPNLLTRRRAKIGCIAYTPIDVAEARWRARKTSVAR